MRNTLPTKVRARREFRVGPKHMGRVAIAKGAICEVVSSSQNSLLLSVKTPRGNWFGYTNWADWELVMA